MENAGIVYGHLVYFPDIWYILWHFGIFCGHLVYFHRFGKLYREKSGNPGSHGCSKNHQQRIPRTKVTSLCQ
jgi:hypothetical protein